MNTAVFRISIPPWAAHLVAVRKAPADIFTRCRSAWILQAFLCMNSDSHLSSITAEDLDSVVFDQFAAALIPDQIR